MTTFREIIYNLRTIADKHHMLNSFHSGFLDEVDIKKLGADQYTMLYSEPAQATIDTGVLTYSFTIYVLDMINEEMQTSNLGLKLGRADTLSENLQILQDVINEFKQNLYSTSWVEKDVVLDTPITAEPFTARFNNLLTGWSATISLQVNNSNSLCDSPIYPNS